MRDVVGGKSERVLGTDAPASVSEASPEPSGSPHPQAAAGQSGNASETSAGASTPPGGGGELERVLRSLAAAEATAAKILADVQAQAAAWARQPTPTVSAADPAPERTSPLAEHEPRPQGSTRIRLVRHWPTNEWWRSITVPVAGSRPPQRLIGSPVVNACPDAEPATSGRP